MQSTEDIGTLKHLDLSKNRFSEENIEFLSRTIKKNLYIEALILDSIGITSTGMASLGTSISGVINLKILALGNNVLGDPGIIYLSNALHFSSSKQVKLNMKK